MSRVTSTRRRTLIVFAGLSALIVVAMMLVARPPERPDTAVSPTPPATSPATATVTASPTPTPAASPSPTAAGTFEDRVLGYRISLPQPYRLSRSTVITAPGELLGVDTYTTATEQEAREACLRDAGHIPTVREPPDIGVTAYRNVQGVSAQEWATRRSLHHKVEPATIGGHEAARLVQDNVNAATTAVIVRAGERVYEIGISGAYGQLPQRWLDDIARTFATVEPAPFPTPTPTVAPRVAAQEAATALSRAFAARDADAVARVMPGCWISVVYAIDGVTPGQGPLNRSVSLFTQGLRERFAAGDLTVTVDPSLQPSPETGRETYFVRSEWREPDRTVPIDLFLEERDGRGVWYSARQHFSRSEISGSGCVPYRSPWVRSDRSC